MKNRRILWISSLILLSLVILLATAPLILYYQQSHIKTWVVERLNEEFAGELVVGHSYISPFKAFPYVSVVLHDVQFFAEKGRQGTPIYEFDDLYLGFGLLQALRGNYEVKRLRVTGGHLHLLAHADGQLNVMRAKGISQESEADTSSSPLMLDLKQIDLDDFALSYHHEDDSLYTELHIQRAKAKIRLEDDHIYVDLSSELDLTVNRFDRPTFFHDKHLSLDLILDYDQQEQLLHLEPSELRLEDGTFEVLGTMDIDNDFDTDIRLYGQKPDFSLLMAFAPPEVAEALKGYEHAGRIFFDGHVVGKFADGQSPFVEANFGCENVYFIEASSNRKLDDFGFRGYYTNGEARTLQSSMLRIENLQARPDRGVFQASLLMENFEDPRVAVNVHSDLDLAFVGEFFGIEGLRRISGQMVLDMDFNELVDFELPENTLVKLRKGVSSDLVVKDLKFLIPDYPHPVEQMNMHAQMREGKVTLDSLVFRIGESDFFLRGTLSDLPALLHQGDQPIEVTLHSHAKRLHFQELLAQDSALAAGFDEELSDMRIDLHFETSVSDLRDGKYLPRGHFFIDDFYGKLKHYPHTLHDFHADVYITDSTLVLEDFSGEIDDTDFHFSGRLEDYGMWFEDNPRGNSRFEFDLVSQRIGFEDLLSYRGQNFVPDDYREEEIRELALHGEVALRYDSTFQAADLLLDKVEGRLRIHPLKLEQFRGRIHLEQDQLQVQQFSGRLGKSDFLVDLDYDLRSGEPGHTPVGNLLRFRSNYLDLDALTHYGDQPDTVAHEDAFNLFALPFPHLRVEAGIAKIRYQRIFLEDFHTKLQIQENHYVYLDTLRMNTAGGSVSMSGYFDGSDSSQIYLRSQMDLTDIELEAFLLKFDNFGQDYLVSDNLKGRVSGRITSKLHLHPDLVPILRDSDAHIELQIVEGSLQQFAPLEALASYFQDRNLRNVRFDTLRNTLDLAQGALSIPTMTINSSLGFIEMEGKQAIEGNMDMNYQVRVPLQLVSEVGFSQLFRGKKQAEVDPDQEDAIIYRDGSRKTRFLQVNIVGNPDQFDIRLRK